MYKFFATWFLMTFLGTGIVEAEMTEGWVIERIEKSRSLQNARVVEIQNPFGDVRTRATEDDNLAVFAVVQHHQEDAQLPQIRISEEQEKLIVTQFDRLALMLDGDDAGLACKRDIWKRLVQKLYIRDIHLEDGEQPDSLSAERIQALLS